MRKRTCQLLADKLKEATSIDLKREDRSGSLEDKRRYSEDN